MAGRLERRRGRGGVGAGAEDLACRYAETEADRGRVAEVESQPRVREAFIARVRLRIEQEHAEQGIEARVEHRVKGYASLHSKLLARDRDLDQIYDVVAFRIITDSVMNCYGSLGLVHGLWRPVPGHFKDFIAMPKPNMYQSLHTTVIDQGQPFELQIRTEQMHRVAEEGIAAHWLYKEGRDGLAVDDQQFQWLRQIVDWQREIPDAREFLASLKIDLYPGEVYVFTPKGEVKVFPTGATPIDFAYAVHTEVGDHCDGAKVNGRLVPLRTPLENGDIIVRNGLIAEVGTDLIRPDGATVVDARGMFVTPGIIDAHSHMGAEAINEGSVNVSSMVTIEDVIDPNDRGFYFAPGARVPAINFLHPARR